MGFWCQEQGVCYTNSIDLYEETRRRELPSCVLGEYESNVVGIALFERRIGRASLDKSQRQTIEAFIFLAFDLSTLTHVEYTVHRAI